MADDAPASAPFLVVDDGPSKKDLSPVYTAIATEKKKGNLTCSGTDEFCALLGCFSPPVALPTALPALTAPATATAPGFLCNYMSTEECEVDLREHISVLAERGSEVITIARAVHSIYESAIRPTLVHVDDDGNKITSPEWSLTSIKKHLLLSGEYESIFVRCLVDLCFPDSRLIHHRRRRRIPTRSTLSNRLLSGRPRS